MSRSSADVAFRVIALQKKVIDKHRLDVATQEAAERGISLEKVFIDSREVSNADLDRIFRTRRRHGRNCITCWETTYLLPGQNEGNTPCEQCGGELRPGAPGESSDSGRSPRASGRQARSSGRQRQTSGRRSPPTGSGKRITGRPIGKKKKPAPDPAEAEPEPTVVEARSTSSHPLLAMGGVAPGGAPPVSASPSGDREQTDEEKQARIRRMRQEGGGFGYEPEPEPETEPEPVARGDADFGYEPGVLEERQRGVRFDEPTSPPVGAPIGAPIPAGGARLGMPGVAPRDRFAPPPGLVTKKPRGPVPPLRSEIGKILTFPFKSYEALVLIAMGAGILMLRRFIPFWFAPLIILFFTYPATYLIRITRNAFLGSEELPGWPEFDLLELLGNGFRLLAVQIACLFPLVLALLVYVQLGIGGFGKGPRLGNAAKSIGPQAHLSAPPEPYIAPGTDCADVTFFTLEDEKVRLDEGKWTIVGFLGRDTADDTGMDQAMVDMPTAGFGVAIMHGFQIYDLDRVGLALGPKVRVLAAYADPQAKVIHDKWAFTDPLRNGSQDEEDDEEDDDEEGQKKDPHAGIPPHVRKALGRARDTAAVQGKIYGGGAKPPGEEQEARQLTNPFKTVQIVKTEGLHWPGALHEIRRLPCVYVFGPDGKIRREYATGVYDEKLYADMQNLLLGGKGDTWSKPLPAKALGQSVSEGGVSAAYGLLAVLVLVGLIFNPICYLLMVAFDSPTTPFMYPAGLRAIAVARHDFIALTVIFVALEAVFFLWLRVMGPLVEVALPKWGGLFAVDFVAFFIAFYASVVTAYAVGRWYYANQEKIGWFDEAAPQAAGFDEDDELDDADDGYVV